MASLLYTTQPSTCPNTLHDMEKLVLQKIMCAHSYDQMMKTQMIPLQPADQTSTFIHCTFDHQTFGVARKFYPNQTVYTANLNLDILKKAGFELRIEANPGGQNKYPHLYHQSGRAKMIPQSAVESVEL